MTDTRNPRPQAVAVFGAAGHTGRFVVAELRRRGIAPIAIARDAAALAAALPDPAILRRQASAADAASLARALDGAGAVINCAGPFLETADAVIAAALGAGIHYLDVTAEQPSAQSVFDRHDAAACRAGVVLIPAMGFYGDRGDEVLTERSPAGKTFLSDIVLAWEASAKPAIDAGIRTVFTRTGLVLAPHGGFAERLLPLVRRGLLRRFGSGREFHAWITIEDQVRATRFLLESTAHEGPANIVAPHATRDQDLIAALARAAGKPAAFPVPAWAMKIAAGDAAVDLLTSQNAEAGVLTRLGFAWNHPSIADAAAWVMRGAGFAPPASPAA